MTNTDQSTTLDPRTLERPHRNLLTYYVLTSFLLGPFFPLILLPRLFRYRTLRYRFDEEGVSMRWGVLFRREVHLNYDRIQDIHLNSNVIERWLGLGRVLVQTASGSSAAELVIEGFQDFEAIRDFLYARMRGTRDRPAIEPRPARGGSADDPASSELATLLREVADELRGVRRALEDRGINLPPSGEES